MKIVSINVGKPREVLWKGMTVQTGIFKEPVDGPVRIEQLNLAGDAQGDLTVRGGKDKAVYAYPAAHYEYWRRELPETAFSWGMFGENLTTEGFSEESLFHRRSVEGWRSCPYGHATASALLQIGAAVRTR